MTEVIICGRWRLREGEKEAALIGLMRYAMIPHYQKSGIQVELGLLRIADSNVYLTTQRWPNRQQWEEFPQSEFYETWLDEYLPILENWDELVELEEEWECEPLL